MTLSTDFSTLPDGFNPNKGKFNKLSKKDKNKVKKKKRKRREKSIDDDDYFFPETLNLK